MNNKLFKKSRKLCKRKKVFWPQNKWILHWFCWNLELTFWFYFRQPTREVPLCNLSLHQRAFHCRRPATTLNISHLKTIKFWWTFSLHIQCFTFLYFQSHCELFLIQTEHLCGMWWWTGFVSILFTSLVSFTFYQRFLISFKCVCKFTLDTFVCLQIYKFFEIDFSHRKPRTNWIDIRKKTSLFK